MRHRSMRIGKPITRRACLALIACCWIALAPSRAIGQSETRRIDLELETGGGIGGLVVDHDEFGIVLVEGELPHATPYVFSWAEIETGSAFRARRALLEMERGTAGALTAEDHFQLGLFALSRGRPPVAQKEFRKAKRLDPQYSSRVRDAIAAFRDLPKATAHPQSGLDHEDTNSAEATSGPTPPSTSGPTLGDLTQEALEGTEGGRVVATPPEIRALVEGVYRSFGTTVQRRLGKGIELIETEHFLIWTDWDRRSRAQLADWCEAMYTALCAQFGIDPSEDVFLAKCPVFCWRNKARFWAFARQFDGYEGKSAVGYTRSIAESGHVHIALFRQGRSQSAVDRFAATLVHEGSHAFMHRLYTTRLIPHWVNEGYAELIAERVLDDRCHTGETADLLAKQYVRYDWSIGNLLQSTGPIPVHRYALAHSIVAYLESLGKKRFAGFIEGLKDGATVSRALADHYDGLTTDQLEAGWRSAVRERHGYPQP